MKFQGYKQIEIDCFIDTGASLCIATKYIIPEEHWENAKRDIKVHIANGSTITINKVCRNQKIKIAGEYFFIPTIYQQETGIDLILGNNFCMLYEPFEQYRDHIILHKKRDDNGKIEKIAISKIRYARRRGAKGFIESMKKDSKKITPEPINITQNKIFRGGEIEENKENDEEQLNIVQRNSERFLKIEKLLEEVCSEHPLDEKITKQWMKASIKLKDPKTEIQARPMLYSPQDRR